MPSGEQLVSTTATIGMPRRFASLTAMSSLRTSMTKSMSGKPPISLMPARFFIRLACSLSSLRPSFFSEHLQAAVLTHRLDVLELLDRLLDRLIVGQKAAEPAVVDVILSAAFGFFFDSLLCLAFGADEKDLLIGPLGERLCERSSARRGKASAFFAGQ